MAWAAPSIRKAFTHRCLLSVSSAKAGTSGLAAAERRKRSRSLICSPEGGRSRRVSILRARDSPETAAAPKRRSTNILDRSRSSSARESSADWTGQSPSKCKYSPGGFLSAAMQIKKSNSVQHEILNRRPNPRAFLTARSAYSRSTRDRRRVTSFRAIRSASSNRLDSSISRAAL